MTTVSEIPLNPFPQRFTVTLSGYVVDLRFYFVDGVENGGWMMDITDNATQTQLVCGIPLLPGENLLEMYPYLLIQGKMYILTDGDTWKPPAYDELGVRSHLLYVTEP